MNIVFRQILFFCWIVYLCFYVPVQAYGFEDHGLAVINEIENQTPYAMTFFSTARPLYSKLGADGSIVRLKSLKTGGGCYYRVVKDKDDVWRLYANGRDSKDLAAQFMISHHDEKYVAFSSDVAEDFYLQSDKKTFEVFLGKEMGDNALWELVEDSRCGDTLNVVHLKNKATEGYFYYIF